MIPPGSSRIISLFLGQLINSHNSIWNLNSSLTYWWLALCVLTWPDYSTLLFSQNPFLGVAVKIFCRYASYLESADLKETALNNLGGPHLSSWKIRSKHWGFQEEEGILPRDCRINFCPRFCTCYPWLTTLWSNSLKWISLSLSFSVIYMCVYIYGVYTHIK